ncbi:ATP dependent DNA ligase, partial [Rubrivivax gelatinosus]|uniref:ATP dependent DNA ligase n=1 Tax=Rubrivivax gelatinosus TaxID=28068 RepID=UPI0031F8282E
MSRACGRRARKTRQWAPHSAVRRGPGLERWVRPELVVEVEFADWTEAGRVRH